MQDTRIALIQGRWRGDRDATRARYAELVGAAAREQATLICLPEFTLSPYFPQTTDEAGFAWAEPLSDGPSARFFGELARIHGVTVVGSLYERDAQGYRNTAVTFGPDGRLVHAARKVHIPSSPGYHEAHFFAGGREYAPCDAAGLRLATPTCYDQWFPEVARIHALRGADLIHYPTAIGSEISAPDFDSREAWQTVMRGHAIANGVYVSAANRVGREGDLEFYGSSFVCDPTGKILAQADRETECFVLADLASDVLTRWRALFPLLAHRRPETYAAITEPVASTKR